MPDLTAILTSWPVLIAIVVMFFVYVCRREIRSKVAALLHLKGWGGEAVFANRDQTADNAVKATEDLKKLGGPTRIEPQLGKPVAETDASDRVPILRESSPLQKQIEHSIRNDPSVKGFAPQHQVDVLVQAQAAVQMQVVFERLYRSIFGSQLFALRLADRPGGIPLDDVEQIFNSAKAKFTDVHKDRTFEQWCQFMLDTRLAEELPKRGDVRMAGVTEIGHEFNVYVTQMRYVEPSG